MSGKVGANRRHDHDEVRRLWAAGVSGREIAAQLGMSKSMVYLVLNDESYARTKRSTADWQQRKRDERLVSREAVAGRGDIP